MENNGCLKSIFVNAGFWLGVLIGGLLFGLTNKVFLFGIAGVVAGHYTGKYVERLLEELDKKKYENERNNWKRLDAIALAKKYPEATKHYFELFWNIRKYYISDSDITIERADKLLSMRDTYEADEIKYNPIFRAKIEEQKANERRENERKKREEEIARKKKEEEKRSLNSTLPACVASWSSHSNSSLKHKYFYDYYSYAVYKDHARASMWDIWRTVWHFKNDPSKKVSVFEHHEALQKVISLVEDTLRTSFGTKTEYLTLVCLTASTQKKTELRYKEFSEKVCHDLNMMNAYSHIQVIEDGNAKHDGGDGSRIVSYDSYFFKNKYIVLFDDVRTTGNSLEQERKTLEGFGAKVICAVTIAQTVN